MNQKRARQTRKLNADEALLAAAAAGGKLLGQPDGQPQQEPQFSGKITNIVAPLRVMVDLAKREGVIEMQLPFEMLRYRLSPELVLQVRDGLQSVLDQLDAQAAAEDAAHTNGDGA